MSTVQLEPFIDDIEASVDGLQPLNNHGELQLDSGNILL